MDIGHAAWCVRHSHGICSQKAPAATPAEGKRLEPGSSPCSPWFPTPPAWISATSMQVTGDGWCWGINLLLENLWAPSGWFLKASDASWEREKQTDRDGAGSTSPVGLHPWRCLLVGSLEGNGNGIPGMASASQMQRKGWFVHPQGTTATIFSLAASSPLPRAPWGSKKQGRCLGHLVLVVWGLPVCLVTFTGNVAALGFPSHGENPLCAQRMEAKCKENKEILLLPRMGWSCSALGRGTTW